MQKFAYTNPISVQCTLVSFFKESADETSHILLVKEYCRLSQYINTAVAQGILAVSAKPLSPKGFYQNYRKMILIF